MQFYSIACETNRNTLVCTIVPFCLVKDFLEIFPLGRDFEDHHCRHGRGIREWLRQMRAGKSEGWRSAVPLQVAGNGRRAMRTPRFPDAPIGGYPRVRRLFST